MRGSNRRDIPAGERRAGLAALKSYIFGGVLSFLWLVLFSANIMSLDFNRQQPIAAKVTAQKQTRQAQGKMPEPYKESPVLNFEPVEDDKATKGYTPKPHKPQHDLFSDGEFFEDTKKTDKDKYPIFEEEPVLLFD